MQEMRFAVVDCIRGREVFRTYEFPFAVPLDPQGAALPSKESQEAEAKIALQAEGLASHPFDGITFQVSYR